MSPRLPGSSGPGPARSLAPRVGDGALVLNEASLPSPGPGVSGARPGPITPTLLPVKVVVFGLGLMGGSLALALLRQPDFEVVGLDPSAAARRLARRAGIAVAESAPAADLAVLAAPIPALPGLLAGLRGWRGKVTDMASTKASVMGWAARAGIDLVGGHPMCGSERSGFAAADPDLFQGATWVLTREDATVVHLVRAVGARPLFMEPERHDRLAAKASHLAYLASVAYVLATSEGDDWEGVKQLAASGYRDVSRLAAGDPDLYRPILESNREAVLDALTALAEKLDAIRSRLETGGGELRDLLSAAKLARDEWRSDAGSS